MVHRVIGEVAVGAGGVIGLAGSSNSRIGAERGRFGSTGAAVVRLGQLEREWP